MENKIGIYCIENKINKKKYIGSSKDVYKRKNRHFSELRNSKHKNNKLQRSYNKHGKDNFIFYVLEFVENENELIIREQYYIDSVKPEYNINLIANSSLGVKRSEETKEKVRQANIGLKHPEWRNKIKSEAQGGENHWTKKKKFSEESKKKMSESQKKLYEEGNKHPLLKSIIQMDLNGVILKVWDSPSIASKELNINADGIRNCARGLTQTSGGFKWVYKN